MNGLLLTYKQTYQHKLEIDQKLTELEKSYLKFLIDNCTPSQTVCTNCWEVIKFHKGNNDHIYKKEFICKTRTIQYQLIKEITNLPNVEDGSSGSINDNEKIPESHDGNTVVGNTNTVVNVSEEVHFMIDDNLNAKVLNDDDIQ
jgi:hypothetical protein